MTSENSIPTPEQLTEYERTAMIFIQVYIATYHVSPDFQEIHAALGLGMAATFGLLQRLREWGYLGRRSPVHGPRNLRVIRPI